MHVGLHRFDGVPGICSTTSPIFFYGEHLECIWRKPDVGPQYDEHLLSVLLLKKMILSFAYFVSRFPFI